MLWQGGEEKMSRAAKKGQRRELYMSPAHRWLLLILPVALLNGTLKSTLDSYRRREREGVREDVMRIS
jgi:hypothetical protein